jgi:hypothetical protein
MLFGGTSSNTNSKLIFTKFFTEVTEERETVEQSLSLAKIKGNFQGKTANISRQELYHLQINIFRRCVVCLVARWWHFENFL